MPQEISGRTFLILSGARGDTRRYRCFHLYEQLRLARVESELAHITDPDLISKIKRAGVVVFHRTAFNEYVKRLLEDIQQRGGLAIFDIDDMIFDPSAFAWINAPDFTDPLRASVYKDDMHRYRVTMEHCHAVMVSTEYLAGQVQVLGKPVWVHRNAFSLEMLVRSEWAILEKHAVAEKVVIGYASGTPTHDRDFDVAKPALREVLQRYPQVKLRLIGHVDAGQDWGNLNNQIDRIDFVPWRELPPQLAAFDINIAPLVTTNPFGQSKSEIKYMEAAMVKVPTIASPTDAYAYAIRRGENGYLATTTQEWTEALIYLIEQPGLRREMGESAYSEVIEKYHPKTRAAGLVDTLDQIYYHVLGKPLWAPLGKPDPKANPSAVEFDWLTSTIEGNPSHQQVALYYLRRRGLSTFLIQVWTYLRRLLAPIFPFKPARK